MNAFEAHALLDAARAGGCVTVAEISDALHATGDLVSERGEGRPDCAPMRQVRRPAGSWERGAGGLLRVAGVWDGLGV